MKKIKNLILVIVLASCGGAKSTTSSPTPVNKDVAVVETVPMTDTERAGKGIFEANCAKCHKLYDPKSRNAETWKPVLLRMQKKAKISDEQREMVYAYLVR